METSDQEDAQRREQNVQEKQAKPKRNVWVPHIPRDEAIEGVKNKTYLEGELYVHPKQMTKAYVRIPGRKDDIIIIGRRNRNRAIHGDKVVVQLQEFEEPAFAEDDAQDSDESDDEIVAGAVLALQRPVEALDKSGATDATRPSKKSRPLDPLDEVAEEEVRDDIVRGSVVHILDFTGRNKGFVCTMWPMKQGEEEVTATDVVVKAVPLVPRFPWILIRLNDEIKKMLAVPGKIDRYEQYYCNICQWNDTSLLPLGKIEGASLGRAGTVEGEIRACIYECGLKDHEKDFSDKLYDYVDDVVEEIQNSFEAEAQKREDLRRVKRVFTIDPATAKDLDDAIHIERVEPNVLEVGVHIADVGHFVKTQCPVDKEAQMRTTSVYMPDRVFPMLPHALCNFLCSLNPHEDKLTFSAFYRIDMTSGVLIVDGPNKPRFAKTVIRSCCRLNYEEAQEILDNPEMEPLPVSDNFTWQQIVNDMFTLYDVCGKTRSHRFKDGGITLHKTKMVFHTRGTSDGVPRDYHLEDHSASHWIIEELMLMANRSVARFLAMSPLEDIACLRNHRYPHQEKARDLGNLIRDCGISWNSRNSKELLNSLREAESEYGEFVVRTLEVLVMQCGMKPAKYYIVNTPDEDNVEQEPFHYALNFDYYTHFTSPIRRYPDIMVHRCLHAILENRTIQEHMADYSTPDEIAADAVRLAENDEEEVEEEVSAVQARKKLWDTAAHRKLRNLCETSNTKKKAHKEASEMCDRSFFCLYLRTLKELWYTNVALIGVDVKGRSALVYAHQLGKQTQISLLRDECPSDFGLDLQVPVKARAIHRGHLRLFWRRPGTEVAAEEVEKEEHVESQEDEQEEDEDEALRRDPTIMCQDILLFGAVPIALVPLDTVPIDYTMLFLSPFHPKFAEIDTLGEQGKGFMLRGEQHAINMNDDDDGDLE